MVGHTVSQMFRLDFHPTIKSFPGPCWLMEFANPLRSYSRFPHNLSCPWLIPAGILWEFFSTICIICLARTFKVLASLVSITNYAWLACFWSWLVVFVTQQLIQSLHFTCRKASIVLWWRCRTRPGKSALKCTLSFGSPLNEFLSHTILPHKVVVREK